MVGVGDTAAGGKPTHGTADVLPVNGGQCNTFNGDKTIHGTANVLPVVGRSM